LSEKEATASFENWFLEFVPGGPKNFNIVSLRPVLVPFYGFHLDSLGKRKVAVYGGYEYSDQQVEALKVDPTQWTRFDSDLLNKPGLALDTWSITPQAALAKAKRWHPELIDLSVKTYQQALLPGYVFEFSRRGQSFHVFVGAQTGKASGLKHFSLMTGLREALTFGLFKGGNIQLKLFIFMLLPRLIPPVGFGLLIYSFFRAFFSPLVSLGVEKVVNKFLPPEYRGTAVDKLLANQWGQFDPAAAQSSGQWQQFKGFDQRERELFQQWFAQFERAFREQQQREFERQQQYYGGRRSRQQQQQDPFSGGGQRKTSDYQERASYTQREEPKEDLYSVLGVSPTATADELRQGFRKKLLQYHPDQYKGKDPEYAKKKTQEIVEAYRTLNNASKRAEYDATRGRR